MPSRAEMRAELHRIQSGKCALCPAISRLEVDHDHLTGLVRGLLCKSCNVREGVVRWSRASAEMKAYRANPPAAALGWLWKLPDWWNVYDTTRARELGLTLIEYIEVFNAGKVTW